MTLQDPWEYVREHGLEAEFEERLAEAGARMRRALATDALPAEAAQLMHGGVLMAIVGRHVLAGASAARREGVAALEGVAARCESPADRRRWRAAAREFERLSLVYAS